MSRVNDDDRITNIRPLSSVRGVENPNLGVNLPDLRHREDDDPPSSWRGGVYLGEGCVLTHSVKYTHQLAHLVNAVRNPSRDPDDIVSLKAVIHLNYSRITDICFQNHVIEFELRIVPYENFNLDDPCNKVLRKCIPGVW